MDLVRRYARVVAGALHLIAAGKVSLLVAFRSPYVVFVLIDGAEGSEGARVKIVRDVDARTFDMADTVARIFGFPAAEGACRLALAHVVCVAIGYNPRALFHVHSKPAQPVAVVGARTYLRIGHKPVAILFLEPHIHRVGLVLHVALGNGHSFAIAAVDLYLADGVGRQVLERHLRITAKEILTVDQ